MPEARWGHPTSFPPPCVPVSLFPHSPNVTMSHIPVSVSPSSIVTISPCLYVPISPSPHCPQKSPYPQMSQCPISLCHYPHTSPYYPHVPKCPPEAELLGHTRVPAEFVSLEGKRLSVRIKEREEVWAAPRRSSTP